MAFTLDDIATLKKAIATGARKVVYRSSGEEREVIYRDLAEMERSLQLMEDDLGLSGRSRTTIARHNRF